MPASPEAAARAGSNITLRSGRVVYAVKHDRDGSRTSAPDIPLFFIHGFYHSSRTWEPIFPFFPQYTRIAFDVEPHGHTGSIGGSLTTKQHAEDAKNVLEYFGYSKAILFGHSAGSLIVHQFAHDYPEKAVKLVYLGPLRLPHGKRTRATNFYDTVTYDDLFKLHVSWAGKRKREDPELRAILKAEPCRLEPVRKFVKQYWAEMMRFEFQGTNDIEAWVIKGTEDTAIHPNACEVIRDLTRARMIEVQTGHFFTFEDPEATAAAIEITLSEPRTAKAHL